MVATLFGSWLVALGLVLWTGWGLAHVLTPPALRSVQILIAPFLGYALISLSAYYGLWLGIALDTTRWVILGLAGIINGLAWWRQRQRVKNQADWHDIGLATGLALGAGVIAVLPLLVHGILAPIGSSWDVEFYLPLATYLRQLPYARLGEALPNPLVPTIQVDPTYARAIGFSYFHGIVDSFGGWDALRTFAPLLGFMRLLGAVAVFLFARYGLGLRRGSAALAASLVALNEVLLWVQYTGFAMHTASMALVPITLLLTIQALRDLRLRTTMAAALLLAGLAANYHPALLGFGALAAGAGTWYVVRGPRRLAVIAHGVATLLLAGGLTFLIQLRVQRAFFNVYEQGAAALGTPGYITLRTLLGLTPLATAEEPAPPPWGAALVSIWPTLIWLAYGLAVALAGWWLARGRGERGLAATMLGFIAIYAFGLRQVVGYPYGHMKGLSFISFVPLAIIAAGVGEFARPASGARAGTPSAQASRPRYWPILAALQATTAALLLLVVGATAWSSFKLVRREPTLYGKERLRLLELTSIVPAGAPVFVSGAEELRGPTMGLAAYALRNNPLVGRTATGYTVYNALPEGATAPYGLLGANDDASAWGFGPQPLWRSSLAALYQAPPGRVAHLHGQPAVYVAPYPTALHRNTALELALLGNGRYRSLDQPVDLAVGANTLTFAAATLDTLSATRTVVLNIGTATTTTVHIAGGGISQTLVLSPGVALIPTDPIATPTVLRIQSDQPALLRWAELYGSAAKMPTQPATLLVTAQVAVGPDNATMQIQALPSSERLRMALEIYEDSAEPRHYGWAVLPLASTKLDLDLARRVLRRDNADVPMTWGERGAGRYFAALWVYQGETLIGRLPLFTFNDDGATSSAIKPVDSNALFVALPTPEQASSNAVGQVGTLVGTTWQPASAGGTARLSAWWQSNGPTPPLLVTAQVLDESDRKWAQWDGVLGGDAAPSTSWAAGDVVRQDIPLTLDPATPAGRYRLLIGVYNPADGTKLPIGARDDLIEEITVPEP